MDAAYSDAWRHTVHNLIEVIAFVAPYLIFVMLLITFCKVKPHEFRVTRLSGALILVQILGSLLAYLALLPFNRELARVRSYVYSVLQPQPLL